VTLPKFRVNWPNIITLTHVLNLGKWQEHQLMRSLFTSFWDILSRVQNRDGTSYTTKGAIATLNVYNIRVPTPYMYMFAPVDMI
jgi:hypothetical protein